MKDSNLNAPNDMGYNEKQSQEYKSIPRDYIRDEELEVFHDYDPAHENVENMSTETMFKKIDELNASNHKLIHIGEKFYQDFMTLINCFEIVESNVRLYESHYGKMLSRENSKMMDNLLLFYRDFLTKQQSVLNQHSDQMEQFEKGFNSKTTKFHTEFFEKLVGQKDDFNTQFKRNIEKTDKMIEHFKKLLKVGIFSLLIAFLISVISAFLAINFYKESIKAKSEIREAIYSEIKDNGSDIYNTKYVSDLKETDEKVFLWFSANPKLKDDFNRFSRNLDKMK